MVSRPHILNLTFFILAECWSFALPFASIAFWYVSYKHPFGVSFNEESPLVFRIFPR